MFDPVFSSILDAFSDPIVVVATDGALRAANTVARRRLPAVLPDGAVLPVPEAERGEARRYLQRCVGSDQPLPGVLRIGEEPAEACLPCWGARFERPGDQPLVLLRLSAPEALAFAALRRAVADLERELAAKERVNNRLEAVLRECQALLLERDAEADRRVAAERDRDEILVRLYGVHQRDRLRLARDLHDHAGQYIACLRLGLGGLIEGLSSPSDREAGEALLRHVDSAASELRRVAVELRPAALEEFGLPTALRSLVEEWGAANRVAVDFRIVGPVTAPSSEAEVTLYRVAQEALTNVTKHAGNPGGVFVILQYGASRVALTVEDDGAGFEPLDVMPTRLRRERFGLVGMNERLALVRGFLEIDSKPGRGTTVFARIPMGEVVRDG